MSIIKGWVNGPETAAHALRMISDGDLITAEGVGSDWDWRSECTVADAMALAAIVGGVTMSVHHFDECWQHNDSSSLRNMIAATRELLNGTAVCDDPEHEADAQAEALDIMEQNEAISRKG
jgi:hypothetical protein